MLDPRYKVPILLIIFNRPETTKIVLDKIGLIKPAELYVVSDGPRKDHPDDARLIEKSRNIIALIDWDCNIHKLYHDYNLGCGLNISSGINWFFENVDQGIIIEDDVVVSIAFFAFAKEMLNRYKYDTRIMQVSAVRYNEEFNIGSASYFFSRHAHICGWATWKRSWKEFNYNMSDFPEWVESGCLNQIFPDNKQRNYWLKKFTTAYNDKNKTYWGHQWQYAVNKNKGYSIVPVDNLAQNIGINGEHNKSIGSHHFRVMKEDFRVTAHPSFIVDNIHYDKYHFKHYVNKKRKLFSRAIRLLMRLLHKINNNQRS